MPQFDRLGLRLCRMGLPARQFLSVMVKTGQETRPTFRESPNNLFAFAITEPVEFSASNCRRTVTSAEPFYALGQARSTFGP